MATVQVVDLQWLYLVVGHLCYNQVLRKIKVADKSDVKNWAYISLRYLSRTSKLHAQNAETLQTNCHAINFHLNVAFLLKKIFKNLINAQNNCT